MADQRTEWALVVVVSIVTLACSTARPPDREADEAAIRTLVSDYEAAIARHDVDDAMQAYLPDADVWIAGFDRISGVEEIRRSEERLLNTPGFESWHASIDAIRFLGFDVAVVESSGRIGVESRHIEEQGTWVLTRQAGEWRIAVVRGMVFREE